MKRTGRGRRWPTDYHTTEIDQSIGRQVHLGEVRRWCLRTAEDIKRKIEWERERCRLLEAEAEAIKRRARAA